MHILLALTDAPNASGDSIGPGRPVPLTPTNEDSPPTSSLPSALTHASKGSSERCATIRVPLSLAGSIAAGDSDPSLPVFRKAPMAAANSMKSCQEGIDEPLESEAIAFGGESGCQRHRPCALRQPEPA